MSTTFLTLVITPVTDNGEAVIIANPENKMYTAKQIIHKGQKRIAVGFANKPELIERFKKLAGRQWSQSLKTWHLPDTEENRIKFKCAEQEKKFDNTETISSNILKTNELENEETAKKPRHSELVLPEILSVVSESQSVINKTPTVPTSELSYPPTNPNCNVSIHIKAKQIIIKLPKSAVDTQFITSFMYCRWDKKNYAWILPNYKNNLDLISIYFDKRISELKIEEPATPEIIVDKRKLIADNERTKTLILTEESKQKIEKYIQWLRSKRYSDNTIKTYSEALQLFLK